MAASSPATAAIGASKKKKLRISDFLHDGSDDVAPAPRLRLPGFTCARIRFGIGRSKGRRGGRKELAAGEKRDAASSSPPPPADDATASGRDAASSAATATAAELGLSLMLLLLARTSVELNKIAEVRAQMEALLAEMRDESASATRKLYRAAAAGRRDLNKPTSSSTSSSLASDYSVLAMATEKPLQEEEEENDEWSSSDGDFIELEGGFGAGDDEDDGDGVVSGNNGGVCGVELERRLREVEQERERERVAELEAALRRARRRLTEKEMEARLWKDTAELALQQRPPPPIAGKRQ